MLIKKVSSWLYQSNRKLEGETERRCSEVEDVMAKLDKLYVAGSWLHSTLNFSEVLREITDMIINLIGAKSLAIFLLDVKTDELTAVIAEGLPLDAVSEGKNRRRDSGESCKNRRAIRGRQYYGVCRHQRSILQPLSYVFP